VPVFRRRTWEPADRGFLKDFDAIQAHISVFSPMATSVARAAMGMGIPTVLSVHSMWSGAYRPLVGSVAAVARWRAAPAVWAPVSAAVAEDIRPFLGERAAMVVVPNAVDVGWWREGADGARSREPRVTLVSVMRLAMRKRPLALIEMLDEVGRRTPPSSWQARIVGEGRQMERMGRMLRRRGMEEHVHLLGGRSPEQIRSLYADAHVYVAPATKESFGIAPLEARSAGLPVVTMASGGVREFVRDGVEGILCRDDEDMVAAMTRLVVDESLRRRMTAYNTRVAPDMDWNLSLEQLGRAYALAADLAGIDDRRPATGTFLPQYDI
jgi:glycosyltransferase involved in cell wall biosynthesis